MSTPNSKVPKDRSFVAKISTMFPVFSSSISARMRRLFYYFFFSSLVLSTLAIYCSPIPNVSITVL
jgi:hypothetical protein